MIRFVVRQGKYSLAMHRLDLPARVVTTVVDLDSTEILKHFVHLSLG